MPEAFGRSSSKQPNFVEEFNATFIRKSPHRGLQ